MNGTNSGLRMVLGDIRSRGPKALAENLADALRQAVRAGRLPAGTSLPASRSLAADLAVSRGVVVRAYEQLVAEGYLTARTGRGTVVGDVHATAGATPPAVDRVMATNPGLPALGWFPRREWLRALETALAEVSDADLGYGDPRGHPRLRQALAAYLGRTRAVAAPVDQIVVTGGYAQAIRLIAEALVRHGLHAIGVEDPGSVGVFETVRAGGLATRPVPVDDGGLDVAALAGGDLRAVAVTRAHQFPTGAVLAPGRRTALLEWAAARRGTVVEDDYDAEYRYDRSPVGALQGLAPDRVVYGGSVSKTLAPGLRLGWVVAPAWLAGTLAEVKHWADIATPVLDQVALAVFIETGALDRHIRRMAGRYAACRDRLLSAVDRHLPGWRVSGVAAGLHAVLVPARPLPATAFEDAAASAGDLRVFPLAAFALGDRPRSGLVLGYGSATPDQIERGVAALATRLP
ncbi:MAG TPA: PLP-dependent aminotransferase family protein [Euzebyales bacterium]|nr:PLP-dependent aminotransferase family protein [Euzebyales bacterium]